jgi:hypothetical protein
MAEQTLGVKIRNALEGDLERIKAIDLELAGADRALSWPLRVETHWWVNRPRLNFVAEVDGQVVGFLLGDIRGSEYGSLISGWIDVMGVSPDYQGQGIGRRLVEAFSDECDRNGAAVRVVIRDDDESLKGFWEALDFGTGKLVIYEK